MYRPREKQRTSKLKNLKRLRKAPRDFIRFYQTFWDFLDFVRLQGFN